MLLESVPSRLVKMVNMLPNSGPPEKEISLFLHIGGVLCEFLRRLVLRKG